jgi:hypothetical protein
MTFAADTRLGPCEILSPLGADGVEDPLSLGRASRESGRSLGEGGYGAALRRQ